MGAAARRRGGGSSRRRSRFRRASVRVLRNVAPSAYSAASCSTGATPKASPDRRQLGYSRSPAAGGGLRRDVLGTSQRKDDQDGAFRRFAQDARFIPRVGARTA